MNEIAAIGTIALGPVDDGELIALARRLDPRNEQDMENILHALNTTEIAKGTVAQRIELSDRKLRQRRTLARAYEDNIGHPSKEDILPILRILVHHSYPPDTSVSRMLGDLAARRWPREDLVQFVISLKFAVEKLQKPLWNRAGIFVGSFQRGANDYYKSIRKKRTVTVSIRQPVRPLPPNPEAGAHCL